MSCYRSSSQPCALFLSLWVSPQFSDAWSKRPLFADNRERVAYRIESYRLHVWSKYRKILLSFAPFDRNIVRYRSGMCHLRQISWNIGLVLPLVNTDVNWCVLMCCDINWYVLLMCTDVYWCILMWTDVFWYHLICTTSGYWCVLMCTDVKFFHGIPERQAFRAGQIFWFQSISYNMYH